MFWRFLDRDQTGCRLPRAALGSVGENVKALVAAIDSLITASSPQNRPSRTDWLGDLPYHALLRLCEASLKSVSELAQCTRVLVSPLRDQLARLSDRGLADSRPQRRYSPPHPASAPSRMTRMSNSALCVCAPSRSSGSCCGCWPRGSALSPCPTTSPCRSPGRIPAAGRPYRPLPPGAVAESGQPIRKSPSPPPADRSIHPYNTRT